VTIDKIKSYYDTYVNHNLRNLMKIHGYGYYHPSKLEEYSKFGDVSTHFEEKSHYNPFVRKIGAPENLGASIISNGMYWPFFINKDTKEVHEGAHRIVALKKYNEKKLINEKTKFLCIYDQEVVNNDFQVDIMFPIEGIINEYGEKCYLQMIDSKRVRKVNDDFVAIYPERIQDHMKFQNEFSRYFSKLIFGKYDDFKGSSIINRIERN